MTIKIAFTQASISRAVRAAKSNGFRVIGISAAGTVLVQDANEPMAIQNHMEQNLLPSKWATVKA
jgi:hypothetical protein